MSLLRWCVLFYWLNVPIPALQIETTVSVCTDIHLTVQMSPNTISSEMWQCLQRGHVYLVSKKAIDTRINQTVHDYYRALVDYDNDHFKFAKRNKDSRRELRSLQRQIITMLTRLRYFATGFNVPSFINLSDGRRLRLINEHIRSVREVLHYVETVPPVIQDFKSRVRNITFVSDEYAVYRRDMYRRLFEESLVELRDWVREQYVSWFREQHV